MSEVPPLTESLRSSLCREFEVRQVSDASWQLLSPFLAPDGQQLPVVLERVHDEWTITDGGGLSSLLSAEELVLSDRRIDKLRRLANRIGATVGDTLGLSLVLDGEPDAFDVADFIQLMAAVRGAAIYSQPDRSREHYSQGLRPKVIEALRTADFEEDWAPPEVDRELYKADLRVRSLSDSDVVVFMCGSSGAADRSALVLDRFRSLTNGELDPLLAYHPGHVSSPSIKRFQDVAQNEDTLVAVKPGESLTLIRALDKRQVLVS